MHLPSTASTRFVLSMGLGLGAPAAPRVVCLPLLPSGPGGVHKSLPHGTQPSTPSCQDRDLVSEPGEVFSPAVADCGRRAPLAPHLAQPRSHGIPSRWYCQIFIFGCYCLGFIPMLDSFRGTIVTIRKAVIPCAGLGTRFLPFTKVMPKELVPLLDKPLIHHAIDEAIASDIEEIVLVTSPEKEALRRYFGEIPKRLKGRSTDNPDLGFVGEYSSWGGTISFVEQQKPNGLGHAVLMAEEAIGLEPFAILLPDDLILSTSPTLKVMSEWFEVYKSGLVAVEKVSLEKVGNYGIIDPERVDEKVYRVNGVVEKPVETQAPSDLAIVGRYIMPPEIFRFLEKTRPGARGEIQLTDGIGLMLEQFPVFAYRFDGIRHDIGNPIGLFGASLALAKRREFYMDVLNSSLDEFCAKRGMSS